jgi:hypothetical protein
VFQSQLRQVIDLVEFDNEKQSELVELNSKRSEILTVRMCSSNCLVDSALSLNLLINYSQSLQAIESSLADLDQQQASAEQQVEQMRTLLRAKLSGDIPDGDVRGL